MVIHGSVTGGITFRGSPFDDSKSIAKLRTKAQMLERIKYLEERLVENHRSHKETTIRIENEHCRKLEAIQARTNDRLLSILEGGSKEGSFPRRG